MPIDIDDAEIGDEIEIVKYHEGTDIGVIGIITEIEYTVGERLNILVKFPDKDFWMNSRLCRFVNEIPTQQPYIFPK